MRKTRAGWIAAAALLSRAAVAGADVSTDSVGPSGGSWPPVSGTLRPPATVEDIAAPVSAAGGVTVRCDTEPAATVSDHVSHERGTCDAPIVAAITAIDQVATQIALECLPKLQSKLPDYAKDWKVLGSLSTGNPVAVAFALGAAMEGDLRECGLDGIVSGLPASQQVRDDLKQVLDAYRTSQEYLDLRGKVKEVMRLAAEPIEAQQLVKDVADAYAKRRKVEGLGKEISDLGKGLASRFKDHAKEVAALEQGLEGLRGLVETARKSLEDQEALAEGIRESARPKVAECRIEAADGALVRAQEAARRALLESRQAIANARELRVCIAEQVQKAVGGASNWRTAVSPKRPGLRKKVREFDQLAKKIDSFERREARRVTLLANIGRQCQILQAEAREIDLTIETYSEIVRSIEEGLADPALCSADGLSGRIGHLKSIEGGRCGWRLPQPSRGVAMSQALEERRLAREGSLQANRELFASLEKEAAAAIDDGSYARAGQILDSMESMAKGPCLDDSVVDSLRSRLDGATRIASSGPPSPIEPPEPPLDPEPPPVPTPELPIPAPTPEPTLPEPEPTPEPEGPETPPETGGSLQILPSSIELGIGERADFQAILVGAATGQTEDVTSRASWPAGRSFAATEPGVFNIVVSLEGMSVSATVRVVEPPGPEDDPFGDPDSIDPPERIAGPPSNEPDGEPAWNEAPDFDRWGPVAGLDPKADGLAGGEGSTRPPAPAGSIGGAGSTGSSTEVRGADPADGEALTQSTSGGLDRVQGIVETGTEVMRTTGAVAADMARASEQRREPDTTSSAPPALEPEATPTPQAGPAQQRPPARQPPARSPATSSASAPAPRPAPTAAPRPPSAAQVQACLCQCVRPKGSDFSCSYDTTDRGWSPSCRDLSNGACICKAFGCFRKPPASSGPCAESCRRTGRVAASDPPDVAEALAVALEDLVAGPQATGAY